MRFTEITNEQGIVCEIGRWSEGL